MQRLKVRNLKASPGAILSIGASGNITSNTNNTLFGVTSASINSGIFSITCFGFTSNSNVYLGRTQLVNTGLRGNTITATANTYISNGIYNVNLYDLETGGSAVLPNGITYANYNAWFSGYDTSLLQMNLLNLTQSLSVRSTSVSNLERQGAVATSEYGWVTGGGTHPTYVSSTSRLTYATDTSGYSTRSNLPYSIAEPMSVTDQSTYGWFGGGRTSSSRISNISRLIFANDTTDSTLRGTAVDIGSGKSSAFNNNYGWFFGGYTASYVTTVIQRLDYSQDTSTPAVRSNLPDLLYSMAAFGTNDYGWTLSGRLLPAGSASSRVLRITYSNDTSIPSTRGPTSRSFYNTSIGVNTNTDGFVLAGNPGGGSVIQRIEFSTDTSTATVLSIYTPTSIRYSDAAFDNFIH